MYDDPANNELPELLMQTDRLLQRYQMACHERPVNGIDPRRGQGRILSLLKKVQEISQKELAYMLDIRQQSLAELLAKLEAADYITRQPSEADRRVMMIYLTEKGAQADMTPPDVSTAFGCLNEEEQDHLREYLLRVSAYLQKQVGEAEETRRSRGPHRPGMMPPPPPGFGPGGPRHPGPSMPPSPFGYHGGPRPPMPPDAEDFDGRPPYPRHAPVFPDPRNAYPIPLHQREEEDEGEFHL